MDHLYDEISTPEEFTQEGQIECNLLTSRSATGTLSKSLEPRIPQAPGTLPTKAADTLGSKDKEHGEQDGANVHSEDDALVQCRRDCVTLTKMALRRKYRREANSHRNMMQRAVTEGRTVHRSLRKFLAFLECVGPQPARGATIDRIDNTDPEYAPDKIRWADKRTQNGNKSNNCLFHDPETGKSFTYAGLATRHKIKASVHRQRKCRGWTDAEMVAGVSGGRSAPNAFLPAMVAKPKRAASAREHPLVMIWHNAMLAAFPDEYHTLTAHEIKTLVAYDEYLKSDLAHHEMEIIDHAIRNWDDVTGNAKLMDGAYGLPQRPLPVFLQKFPRAAVNVWIKAGRPKIKIIVRIDDVDPAAEPADPVERQRNQDWAEHPFPTFDDMEAQLEMSIRPEIYVKNFGRWWRSHKEKMILESMPPWALELVVEIDPTATALTKPSPLQDDL